MNEAAPTLPELLQRSIDSRLADVHVSMPGIVVSYDAATKTATIQPALRRVVFDEDSQRVEEEIPPIQNVPVSFPGSSKLTIHFGLNAGDTGDIVFSTNALGEWQSSGRVSTPGDLKLHGLGGAKFYPGLRSRVNVSSETDESIGIPEGLRLSFTASAIKAGMGTQFVALAALVDARLATIETWAAEHTHAVPSFGTSAQALPALVAGSSTASTNLKAD